ncbi:hypothetical protein OH77DRAFT_240380 [Trametes cingulata]|nr:hypothetical protein OH77DRAFT_240380 [Trametes cingulata]
MSHIVFVSIYLFKHTLRRLHTSSRTNQSIFRSTHNTPPTTSIHPPPCPPPPLSKHHPGVLDLRGGRRWGGGVGSGVRLPSVDVHVHCRRPTPTTTATPSVVQDSAQRRSARAVHSEKDYRIWVNLLHAELPCHGGQGSMVGVPGPPLFRSRTSPLEGARVLR